MNFSTVPNVLSTVMRGSSPAAVPAQAWVPEGLRMPQISRVDQLLQAARERLGNARGAADMRRRTQEEQGMRSYAPANPEAADTEILRRTWNTQAPMPTQEAAPTELRQRPTGGVVASYGPTERVVTSRYGTGSAVIPTGERKPATFDGVSKEAFFGQAAARQGQDNAFARAEKTGEVDKFGDPLFTGKAIPKGNTASSERIFEAMKKGVKPASMKI